MVICWASSAARTCRLTKMGLQIPLRTIHVLRFGTTIHRASGRLPPRPWVRHQIRQIRRALVGVEESTSDPEMPRQPDTALDSLAVRVSTRRRPSPAMEPVHMLLIATVGLVDLLWIAVVRGRLRCEAMEVPRVCILSSRSFRKVFPHPSSGQTPFSTLAWRWRPVL